MKLIFCPVCEDLFRLFEESTMRLCRCGKSGGRYVDDEHAEIIKGSVSVAINNLDFFGAVAILPVSGNTIARAEWKKRAGFEAWVRPNCAPGNPHSIEVDKP